MMSQAKKKGPKRSQPTTEDNLVAEDTTFDPEEYYSLKRKPPQKIPENYHPRQDAFGPIIEHPEKYDSSIVIEYNQKFVTIHDAFPKASVHYLILPRDKKFWDKNKRPPYHYFDDPAFLSEVREYTAKIKEIAANALQQKFGRFSAKDKPLQDVLDGVVSLDENSEPPVGRDWESEILVGIHTYPSMAHLHIHVTSREMYSERLKKCEHGIYCYCASRKHYNSFQTRFFVGLDEFPLSTESTQQRLAEVSHWPSHDLICWRCNKNFHNKFTMFKSHLAEEFLNWKKE